MHPSHSLVLLLSGLIVNINAKPSPDAASIAVKEAKVLRESGETVEIPFIAGKLNSLRQDGLSRLGSLRQGGFLRLRGLRQDLNRRRAFRPAVFHRRRFVLDTPWQQANDRRFKQPGIHQDNTIGTEINYLQRTNHQKHRISVPSNELIPSSPNNGFHPQPLLPQNYDIRQNHFVNKVIDYQWPPSSYGLEYQTSNESDLETGDIVVQELMESEEKDDDFPPRKDASSYNWNEMEYIENGDGLESSLEDMLDHDEIYGEGNQLTDYMASFRGPPEHSGGSRVMTQEEYQDWLSSLVQDQNNMNNNNLVNIQEPPVLANNNLARNQGPPAVAFANPGIVSSKKNGSNLLIKLIDDVTAATQIPIRQDGIPFLEINPMDAAQQDFVSDARGNIGSIKGPMSEDSFVPIVHRKPTRLTAAKISNGLESKALEPSQSFVMEDPSLRNYKEINDVDDIVKGLRTAMFQKSLPSWRRGSSAKGRSKKRKKKRRNKSGKSDKIHLPRPKKRLREIVSNLTLDGERLVDVVEASSDLVAEDFAVEIDEGEAVETIRFRHPQRIGSCNFLAKLASDPDSVVSVSGCDPDHLAAVVTSEKERGGIDTTYRSLTGPLASAYRSEHPEASGGAVLMPGQREEDIVLIDDDIEVPEDGKLRALQHSDEDDESYEIGDDASGGRKRKRGRKRGFRQGRFNRKRRFRKMPINAFSLGLLKNKNAVNAAPDPNLMTLSGLVGPTLSPAARDMVVHRVTVYLKRRESQTAREDNKVVMVLKVDDTKSGNFSKHEHVALKANRNDNLRRVIRKLLHFYDIKKNRAKRVTRPNENGQFISSSDRGNSKTSRPSNAISKTKRQKRRRYDKPTVEIYFYTDDAFYDEIRARFPKLDKASLSTKISELLTEVMNAAETYLLHPTFGLKVKLRMMKVRVLKDEGPKHGDFLESLLGDFHSYLKSIGRDKYVDDSSPDYGDVSVLITGRKYVSLAGFAYMSTMCVNPEFSQIVLKYFWDTVNNRANKPQLATMGKILAHELAHVFGVQHDGEHGKNKCSEKMTANRLMTPIISHEAKIWSLCSKRYVADFVRKRAEKCLYH